MFIIFIVSLILAIPMALLTVGAVKLDIYKREKNNESISKNEKIFLYGVGFGLGYVMFFLRFFMAITFIYLIVHFLVPLL